MTDCTAPRHDRQDEPTPTDGSRLCRPCRTRLRGDLTRLPARYTALADTVPGRGHGDGSGLPYNDPAAECRGQIRHDLAYWSKEVATDRRTQLPMVQETVMVPFLAGWLTPHLKWIPYREWAPHMAGAIADNIGRAEAILNPRPRTSYSVPGADGICIECDHGRLHVTQYLDPGDRRMSMVACRADPILGDGCGHTWTSEQFLRLGKRVISRREEAACA